jgi:DNA invertase Pin-like site-specific DNA recombinase
VRTALYARISTSNHGQDSEVQLRELREHFQRRGWEIIAEYVDNGISGSKDSRPELNRLMAHAHKRRFDAVAVWKFDRFARSTSHLLRALETFQSLGIEFISLTESIDTTTPVGKMVFTILGAVAQMERELTRERIRAGLRNAKAKGRRLGRPKASVNVAQIGSLRQQGLSYKAIAQTLGISVGTVHAAAFKKPHFLEAVNA